MGKRNRSFMILGGLAAATALAGTASAFWNLFVQEGPAAEAPQSGQSLRADFTNASVEEVFKWLRGQGIDFVVETTDIANRKITMNVTAKSKDALLNAIADALGFSVTKKDNTYVLKKSAFGAGNFTWERSPMDMFHRDGKPMTPEERSKFEKEFGNSFRIFGDGKELTPEQRAKMEKELGDSFKILGDNLKVFGNFKEMTPEERAKWEKEWKEGFKAFGDNFKVFGDFKDMSPEERAKWEKQYGKLGENFKMFGDGKVWENGKSREMTKEEKAEFEKRMKEWGKNFGEGMKHFGEGMKNFHFDFDFDKNLFPKVEKELQEQLKRGTVKEDGKERPMTKEERAEIEKAIKELKEGFKHFPKMNFHGMSEEDRKKFEAEMEEFHKNMKDLPKIRGNFHMGEGFHLNVNGIKELKASLTSAQKELMKKQGHLKLSDLTDAQKKMIGVDRLDGDFDMSFQDDDLKIVIKSK